MVLAACCAKLPSDPWSAKERQSLHRGVAPDKLTCKSGSSQKPLLMESMLKKNLNLWLHVEINGSVIQD